MDALAMLGLAEGQLEFVDCLDHLNRTDEYGVTFERAARLNSADRSHIHIAGTASIDANGQILHDGDVLRQVDRALENVSALLEVANASLDDMASMTLYLRDAADAKRVVSFLDVVAMDLGDLEGPERCLIEVEVPLPQRGPYEIERITMIYILEVRLIIIILVDVCPDPCATFHGSRYQADLLKHIEV